MGTVDTLKQTALCRCGDRRHIKTDSLMLQWDSGNIKSDSLMFQWDGGHIKRDRIIACSMRSMWATSGSYGQHGQGSAVQQLDVDVMRAEVMRAYLLVFIQESPFKCPLKKVYI